MAWELSALSVRRKTKPAIREFSRDTRIESTGRHVDVRRVRIGPNRPRSMKRCSAICFAISKLDSPGCRLGMVGRLEVELPAFLVSLTMHGLLLVCLAFAGYRVHQESSREFQAGVVDNLIPSSDSTFQDLDQSANPPATIAAAGSFAPTLAPTITIAPSSAGRCAQSLLLERLRREERHRSSSSLMFDAQRS